MAEPAARQPRPRGSRHPADEAVGIGNCSGDAMDKLVKVKLTPAPVRTTEPAG